MNRRRIVRDVRTVELNELVKTPKDGKTSLTTCVPQSFDNLQIFLAAAVDCLLALFCELDRLAETIILFVHTGADRHSRKLRKVTRRSRNRSWL